MRQDLKGALRSIRRHRGLSAVVILTLALAIGANTAIFSLADGLLLAPLPVHDPQGLLLLKWEANGWPKGNRIDITYGACDIPYSGRAFAGCTFSPRFLHELQASAHTLAGVTAFGGDGASDLVANGSASSVNDELVAGNFFQVLGLKPQLGRLLEPNDDRAGAPAVMVLSDRYWRSRFGGNPAIVGATVKVNQKPVTVVGVAGPRFTGLTPGSDFDAWAPLSMRGRAGWPSGMDALGSHWLILVGRARPGVSAQAVQTEVSAMYRDAMLAGPAPLATVSDNPRLVVLQAQASLAGTRAQYRQPVLVLVWLVGAILLLACANIAGLLVGRAQEREREFSVRRALGATRWQLLRQLLAESLALAIPGGVIGVAMAWFLDRALAAALAYGNAYHNNFRAPLDGRVLLVALGTTILIGVLAGLAPALWHARRKARLGRGLVVAQLALCLMLLAGAGLLVRTLVNLRSVDLGFAPQHLLLFGIDPSPLGYNSAGSLQVIERVQRGIATLPGVENVSYAQFPLLAHDWTRGQLRTSASSKAHWVDMLPVGQRYFVTMKIPLVAGREFGAGDFAPGRQSRRSAIVNQAFVQQFLPQGEPLGREFAMSQGGPPTQYTVIGVVSNARYSDLRSDVPPLVYPPEIGYASFVVRTAGAPMALLAGVRRVVHGVDAELPVLSPSTEEHTMDQLLFRERLLAHLASLFGALALLLAAIGIYALLAQEVTRRTREIGIRMALGAERRRVIRMVMARGAALAVAGIVAGLAGAIAATRYLHSMLYGVTATDPLTLSVVGAILFVVALLACWLPARRASRVDPMVALRYE